MKAKESLELPVYELDYELVRTYSVKKEIEEDQPRQGANYVTFSPDLKFIVCGYLNGVVVFYDYKTAEVIKKIRSHTAKVMHIEFNRSGDLMCSAGADNNIILYDVNKFNVIDKIRHPKFHNENEMYEIRFCLFSDDNMTLYYGTNSGCLFCHDLFSVDESRVIVSPKDMYPPQPYFLTSGIFSPDEKYIVFASGYSLKFVNLETNKVEKMLGVTEHFINDFQFVPGNPDLIATWSQNGIITFWNNKTNKKLVSFEAGDDHYCHISFSKSGKYLASANCGNIVKVWDAQTKLLLTEIKTKINFDSVCEGHNGAVKTLTFLPEEDLLLTGSLDGTAKLWRLIKK